MKVPDIRTRSLKLEQVIGFVNLTGRADFSVGFKPATYGFVDEARLANLLKLLEPEKTKLLFFLPQSTIYTQPFSTLCKATVT